MRSAEEWAKEVVKFWWGKPNSPGYATSTMTPEILGSLERVIATNLRAYGREVGKAEQRRAIAYLDVLATNHPHLHNAYTHARKNMEAMFQTDWQPLDRQIEVTTP